MRMPHARQLPSGAWNIRVTVNGSTVSITESTEARAVARAAKLKASAHALQYHPGGATVGEIVDEYIAGRDGILSPSTIKAYQSYRDHRFQRLMVRRINTINSAVCQQAISDEARHTSPKTVRNAWGLVYASVTAYAPDLVLRVTLPKKSPSGGGAISPEVLREVFRLIEGSRYELPILLMAFTGLRRSELFAVRKSDFDFAAGTLKISRAFIQTPDGRWIERDATKTAAGCRVIHVERSLLERVQGAQDGVRLCDGINPNTIYTYLDRLCKRHQLPHIRVHDFRHTFASVSHLLGVPQAYTMRAGGWASRPVLEGVYTHAIPEEEKRFSELVDGYLAKLRVSDKTDEV